MTSNDARAYQIRLAGHLDDHWSAWFGDLTIACHDDGTCTLTGPVTDQAQLHGILTGLRDIGATLISVYPVDGQDAPQPRGHIHQPAAPRNHQPAAPRDPAR